MTALLDFTPAIERDADRRARAADIIRRDRALGGTVPGDKEDEIVRRAVKAWLAPYRADVTRADLRAATRSNEPATDYRTISVGRLTLDVRRAVSRWSKYRKTDAPIVEARALMLILQWPEHGSPPSAEYPRAELTDLGGRDAERMAWRLASMEPTPSARTLRAFVELERILRVGTLPARRVWLDAERRDRNGAAMLTRGAMRALRAAVKQAGEDLRAELESDKRETPSGDALDFSELIERDAETVSVSRLPRVDMPETVARLMDIPLDAARALVARAFPEQIAELAELWGMAHKTLEVALSRGRVKLRDRYPTVGALLDAVDAMADAYRAELERDATLALLETLTRPDSAPDAHRAVLAWRDAQRYLPDAERAELDAARAALQRHARNLDAETRAELADRIARSSRRLMLTEQRRAKRGGRMRQTGDLARTYPGASWSVREGTVHVSAPETERATPSKRELTALAVRRAELRDLLESGSSDADRIRTLRAELRAA